MGNRGQSEHVSGNTHTHTGAKSGGRATERSCACVRACMRRRLSWSQAQGSNLRAPRRVRRHPATATAVAVAEGPSMHLPRPRCCNGAPRQRKGGPRHAALPYSPSATGQDTNPARYAEQGTLASNTLAARCDEPPVARARRLRRARGAQIAQRTTSPKQSTRVTSSRCPRRFRGPRAIPCRHGRRISPPAARRRRSVRARAPPQRQGHCGGGFGGRGSPRLRTPAATARGAHPPHEPPCPQQP